MTAFQFQTASPDETICLAKRLAGKLKPGDVITLEGDLGAGKTFFTKGLAVGLGIKGNVNSPTFTIIKEYKGSLPLYHMDGYRLTDEEDLGLDEYFEGDGVTVVEWASRIENRLPSEQLKIEIEWISEQVRVITMNPSNSHYVSICKELQHESSGD